MADLIDALRERPGLYVGQQATHVGKDDDQLGVARILVSLLPGGGGVALDYEVLVAAGAPHQEHAMLARGATGVVLVTAFSHSPVVAVIPEAPGEPGWFPAPTEAGPFPIAVRIEVPEPGRIVYSWSYGRPGEELQVRDVGDVRLVE